MSRPLNPRPVWPEGQRARDAPRRSSRRDARARGRPLVRGIVIGVLATQLAVAVGAPHLKITRAQKVAATHVVAPRSGDRPAGAPLVASSTQAVPEAVAAPVASTAAATSSASITVNWVGDTALGSRAGAPADATTLLGNVARQLAHADLTIGNLEGTFGVGGASKCGDTPSTSCYAFQAPPQHAAALSHAGFDLMSIANNHALDYGLDGQRQTITALDRAHIRHAGRPGAITLLPVRGVHVAVVGFAPYPWASSLTDIPAARELVNRAAKMADLVIVLMHAGAEGADKTHTPDGTESQFGEDRGYARGFAHAVIDGGADLVLGSGPHVVRGMEWRDRRLIAYSLGNFAGYSNFSTGGALSASGILHVQLGPTGRLVSGRWISLRLEPPGIPRLDPANGAAHLVAQLSREDFGPDGVHLDDRGDIRRPLRP